MLQEQENLKHIFFLLYYEWVSQMKEKEKNRLKNFHF